MYPKTAVKRADGAGWKYPHIAEGPGSAHLLSKAMDTGELYPVKAYIAYRHDPLMGFPDPERLKPIFAKLDVMVAVTFTWSDTAWFSNVILPLSRYLERENILAAKNRLKPYFFVRRRVLNPRFDTKADWPIFIDLAKRLILPKLALNDIRDI